MCWGGAREKQSYVWETRRDCAEQAVKQGVAAAWQEQPAHADFLLSACLCLLLLLLSFFLTD